MLPYFATYAAEAHKTGVPILRHLVLQYPDDPRSATAEYQYLLGDSLLVAPVIEQGAVSRKLYLPQGEWVNYWTQEHYQGGKDITVAAPLEQIPIMVRAGAILPFKPESETAGLHWSDRNLLQGALVWKAYPGKADTTSSFTLPDGTAATLRTTKAELQIQGTSPQPRAYEIILALDAKPAALQLNNQLSDAWHYDDATHQLRVAVTGANFTLQITRP